MPPVFGLPPRIQKMSGKHTSAFATESALVALESLTYNTRPRRPSCSMRCARPGKLRRPLLIASSVMPSVCTAAIAAAAFWRLWLPRSEPMPERSKPRGNASVSDTRMVGFFARSRRSAMARVKSSSVAITAVAACATSRSFTAA